jgi:radical SAM protein with 4Fe4S-binding SPASM domain
MIRWVENIQIAKNGQKVFLINCFEGTWLRIHEDAIEDCNNHLIGRRNKEQIQQNFVDLYEILIKYRMITDDTEDLQHFSRANTIYFLLTLQCNMECDFCCICASPKKNSINLEKEVLVKFIDEMAKTKIKKVILTGGEPLLYENIDFLVTELRKKMKSTLQICTNGLLINDANINIFSKIDLVDISVENLFCKPQEYEINKLTKKINILKELNIGICLSYVVTEYNGEMIYKFIDYAYANDVRISTKIVLPIGRAETNADILVSEENAYKLMVSIYKYIYINKYFNDNMKEFLFPTGVPEKQCAASGKILSVYPDGNVYSCFLLNKDPYCLGNIKKESLQEIIINNRCKNETEFYKSCFDKDRKEICRDCEVRYFCEGNCSGISSNKNVMCEFNKKYFSFYMWYYSESNSLEKNLKDFLNYVGSNA